MKKLVNKIILLLQIEKVSNSKEYEFEKICNITFFAQKIDHEQFPGFYYLVL